VSVEAHKMTNTLSDRRFRQETCVNLAAKERELIERTKRFIKAELKRADVTYEELAERLREHGLEETKGSIAAKISRGAFPATFFAFAHIAA
jgi:Domain of unknown function (DUF6471)